MNDNIENKSIAVMFQVPLTSAKYVLDALADAAAEVQRVADNYPPVSVHPDSPRPHAQQARHSLTHLYGKLQNAVELQTSESK